MPGLLRSAILAAALFGAAFAASPASPADDAAFRSAAAAQYQRILAALSSQGKLDDDPALLARARRISGGLIAAAAQSRPEVAAWEWEVHVTTDPARGTFCIAGGKVLVGGEIVRQLALDDGELAMLLGHEIAHALAGHRRAATRPATDSDAAQEVRATEIAVAQETEADRIGMELAYRAGWPTASLVSFFDKLAAAESPGTFSSSHPPAQSRAAMGRDMADALRSGR